MKRATRFLTILALIAALALAALPAFAQESTAEATVEAAAAGEVIITEQQINQAYRVTNPRRTSVTNVYVDLQPGQVVINATITFRGQSPLQTVTTMVPSIVNNRLNWTVVSVTSNGQPVSGDLLTQINNIIAASWANYFKTQAGVGRIQSVTVTDTEIILNTAAPSSEPGDSATPVPTAVPTQSPATSSSSDAQASLSTEVIITEQQINQAYRVTNPRRTSVTNVYVDLQPGQVVINATITFYGQTAIQTTTVMVPSIVNNRLNWTVVSVTSNGQPVSGDLLTQINNIIATSWANYFKTQAGAGRIQSVTITDSEMILN